MEERIDKALKISYVGNNLLNIGFKIAGVSEAYAAMDTRESENRIKMLLEDQEIGIIIITSSVRRMIKDRRLSDAIVTSIMPLVVEVPEPGESADEEDTLRMLIMRAIGIDISKMFNK